MRLTCVTAVFNAVKAGNAEKLERCVRSVAALKTPHEHIVVDGASTDGTVELLEKLQEEGRGTRARDESEGRECPSSLVPSLRIISERDTGIYNALNKGLKAAQGEWFYVLGSDDYICAPEVMDELLRDEGRGTRNEERGTRDEEMVVTPARMGETAVRFSPARDLWKVLWCTPYCHQGVLMRTDAVRRFGGFDERYRIAADYDLMLQFHLAARPIRYVERTFAHFDLGGSCGRQVEIMAEDFRRIGVERLGLSESEAARYRRTGILPLRRSLAFLLHPDRAVRQGARRMLKRGLAHLAGLKVKPLDI